MHLLVFALHSVNTPACGSYRVSLMYEFLSSLHGTNTFVHPQCEVEWQQGTKVYVNWINPPPGSVSISLASNTGGAVYPISSNTLATDPTNQCDSGKGHGVAVPGVPCGGVQFIVPGGWVPAANCK